jgi:hypothetical protein
MGFLDRLRHGASEPSKQSTSQPPATSDALSELIPAPDEDGWYGRRFRTPSSVEECHENLKALLLEGEDDERVFDARWVGSSPAPDVLFGIRDTQYGVLYVAIWQSGSMVAGQREIAIVPTRFDQRAPMPLAGQWKMRDSALASIGHVTQFPVESAEEG